MRFCEWPMGDFWRSKMKTVTTKKESRKPAFEIFFKKENDASVCFIKSLEPPFLIGKVIKLRCQYAAMDYAVAPVQYCKEKIKDLNIFVIQSGFAKKPSMQIKDEQITACLKQMCNFYFKEVIESNKIMRKTYATVDKELL